MLFEVSNVRTYFTLNLLEHFFTRQWTKLSVYSDVKKSKQYMHLLYNKSSRLNEGVLLTN